ncbi:MULTISPECIES: methyltransferase domain-containing protein [Giesbergeria]|uniref:Methyltransferase domain-containing protein n=1 Tax=Giesbergeria sinuosa TaxID=80883 RepID=A0ABV9QIP5_9BURK
MKCRHCAAPVTLPLIDLGTAPPSNAYLDALALHGPERWYPLRVLVCEQCWLAQTEDFAQAEELFSANYAYFSSYSSTWLAHAQAYVDTMVRRWGLDQQSKVVEIAANDGYLLQYVAQYGIPCLGVEPTTSTASVARARGIPIVEEFFGTALAQKLLAQGHTADLMVANNVLAHVPDINDFVTGFATLLKPSGVASFEFPHLLQLVQQYQFDTIYHEHFSYLSLTSVQRVFAANGLTVFDVEELPTHGGSLRVLAQRTDGPGHPIAPTVSDLLERETAVGMSNALFYQGLQAQALRIKRELLTFLLEAQAQGRKVVAYGAAAKGNTLLNFAGVRSDLLPYVVDRNPAKQGQFLPDSRIPIVDEQHLCADRPDVVLILPWNLQTEVRQQLAYVHAWGGQLAVAIPHFTLLPQDEA